MSTFRTTLRRELRSWRRVTAVHLVVVYSVLLGWSLGTLRAPTERQWFGCAIIVGVPALLGVLLAVARAWYWRVPK